MANSRLRFSIIIGAYNAEPTIGQCLESLGAQTFDRRRYEIIVVDDGSRDRTAEITRKHPRVQLVVLRKNRGVSAARNAGLNIARGEIVVSYDADCIADQNWLTELDRAYQDNPTAAGIAGRLINGRHRTLFDQYLDLSGYGNPSRMVRGRGTGPLGRLTAYFRANFFFDEPKNYYEIHHAFGANASFRTEMLRAIGGWNVKLRSAEDSDISERLRRHFPDRPLIANPKATLIHDHAITIPGFITRSYHRGPTVLAYYRNSQQFPPVFPGPIAFTILTALSLLAGATILIPFLPLICYPWHLVRFFLTRQPQNLAFAYIEFANESASSLGLLDGATRPHAHRAASALRRLTWRLGRESQCARARISSNGLRAWLATLPGSTSDERICYNLTNNIQLTFDDQATAATIHALLEVLSETNVQASFFLTGSWAKKHPELADQIRTAGHTIGSHGQNHQNLRTLTSPDLTTELTDNLASTHLRPPYGEINPRARRAARRLGMRITGWTIDSQDWRGISPSHIQHNVTSRLHPGAVVLLHLHVPATLVALPGLIKSIRARGYTLPTLHPNRSTKRQ